MPPRLPQNCEVEATYPHQAHRDDVGALWYADVDRRDGTLHSLTVTPTRLRCALPRPAAAVCHAQAAARAKEYASYGCCSLSSPARLPVAPRRLAWPGVTCWHERTTQANRTAADSCAAGLSRRCCRKLSLTQPEPEDVQYLLSTLDRECRKLGGSHGVRLAPGGRWLELALQLGPPGGAEE